MINLDRSFQISLFGDMYSLKQGNVQFYRLNYVVSMLDLNILQARCVSLNC